MEKSIDKHWSTYDLDIAGKKTIEFVLNCINNQFEQNHRQTLKILDVGCGTGQLTKIVAKQCDCNILAIDIDEKSLEVARQSLIGINTVNIKKSSVEEFDSTEKYDVILMTQVLDHISEPDKLLHQCNRLLSEDGQIIIGISNGYGIYEFSKKIFPNFAYRILEKSPKLAKLKETPYTCNRNSPHLHKFSFSSLKKTLADSHFKIDTLGKMTFILPAFPICLLYYLNTGKVASLVEKFDYFLAEILPASFSANWYISCKIFKDK